MAPREDPGYTKLLLLVGEIAGDVKNVLTHQTRQDDRIDRNEARQSEVNDEVRKRIVALEKFKGKLLGIAVVIPLVLSLVWFILERFNHG